MKMAMRYIILYVSDREASVRFYRDLLGLPVRREQGTYIEFDTGSTMLALNTKEFVREMMEFPVPNQTSHSFEIGFVVEDVRAEIERLSAHGVPVLTKPALKPWGQTVAYISDPDGHYIEICSSMDHSSPE